MDCNRTAIISFCVLFVCSLRSLVVAVFVGPDDTSVLRGQTATLQCSNDAFVSGVRQWSEGGVAFADQTGVFSGMALTKYQDFQINAPSSTQIDLIIPDAQVGDEGSYECQISPDTATAVFTVEIQGNTSTITLNGDSSGDPIILTADVESTLRCTATGYRPAVNLEWYKNNVKITAGVSEDSPTASGDTFETSGTLTLTPTKDDNEASVECRTTGQQVAPAQTQSLSLNVQYKPVVSVAYEFSTNTISCSADANPITNIQYVIYLNNTAQDPGQTLKYNNDDPGCTSVRCNVTNSIGTGTAEIVGDLCPSARPYPSMTAKTMVAKLKDGYRMPQPKHCKKELYSMMTSCWLRNPNKRPTFRSLFKQLDKSLTSEAEYISLSDLDENIYEVTKIRDEKEKL